MPTRYLTNIPRKLRAKVHLPASKSLSNRALVLRALSSTPANTIDGLSKATDTLIMARLLEARPEVGDVADAGTAMRFLTAFFAFIPGSRILKGSDRMHRRPIGPLVDALRQLDARIQYLDVAGFPPLHIEGGTMKGGQAWVSGALSSQFASALLMLGPFLPDGLTLRLLPPLVSRPYLDMTCRLMQSLGLPVQGSSPEYRCHPVVHFDFPDFVVEPDWSAAIFWSALLTHMDMGSKVILPGLSRSSLQGDARTISLMEPFGVFAREHKEGLELVKKSHSVNPREALCYDMVDVPDLIPPLVATCLVHGVPFQVKGTQTLRDKECDRIDALEDLAACLGLKLEASHHQLASNYAPDARPATTRPTTFNARNDHRMVMSGVLVAARFPFVGITHVSAVAKSYPQFWNELYRLGFEYKDYIPARP